MDFLYLKGGPSNQLAERSSDPVTILKGLVGLKSIEVHVLECPVISPTLAPVSEKKIAPNLN